MASNRKRYDHQLEAKQKAYRLKSMGFFMGMRTGKTLTAIDTVQDLEALPCLIVSPLAAIATWKAELLREGIPEEEIIVVRTTGGAKAAQNLLCISGSFYIINFESVEATDALNIRTTWQPFTNAAAITGQQVEKQTRAPRWLNLPDWRAVIIDESYKIANGASKITQYLLQRPKPLGQSRFCLSGTPAAENPYQYASQFIFMDGHFFGCRDVATYLMQYWRWNEYKREYRIIDAAHLDDVREFVQDHAYCVTMYELGLGCEVFRTSREVPANQKQQDLFYWLQFARTYTHKKTGELMEIEPGVRALMHRQIAAGVDPLTDEFISDEKILDFIQYVKDTKQKILVSSFFKPPILRAVQLCQEHGLKAAAIYGGVKEAEAEKIRLDFQAGKLDVVIGQEDKISRGLEFSKLDTIFILSASFSEEAREQLEERGQHVARKEPYEIISQHTKGSAEESITYVLTVKKVNARYYLDKINMEILTHKKFR